MEGVGSVLVIDDEPVLQDVLGTLLRGAGFDYHGAMSAEEGLQQLRDEEIDVDLAHVALPFHGARKPMTSLFSGEFFWTADLVRSIEGVRAAIGYEIDLAIDCHGQFDLPSAITLAKAVEPLRLMWLEEPVPAENLDALAQEDGVPPASLEELVQNRFGEKD